MPRSLAARAVMLTCAVAVISVLVTALVGYPFALRQAEQERRQVLREEADVVAVLMRRTAPAADQRLARELRAHRVDVVLIRGGVPDRDGLPATVVDQVAAGGELSGRVSYRDRNVFAEGRSLGGRDGVILLEPLDSPLAELVWRRLWLALLAGLVAGAAAGALLANRLARPIRSAAVAAGRLTAGDRAVRLPVAPPTEAAELATAINELAAALAASEGRQREFLLSVSHELRTPLTTLRGYAEALADGVVGPDGARRAGTTMLSEAVHLDRLVADLLALARLEAADFPVTLIPVDLGEQCRRVAEAWGGRCADAGAVLRTEIPPVPVVVHTDPGRLRQVVDGLLDNAVRAVPAGAPIVLAVREDGLVEVRDGGPGLTDDDLAIAFERGALHQRYQGVRKVGSGLGLALADRLVRRLGGRLEAGHAPEGGARFTVYLPRTSG